MLLICSTLYLPLFTPYDYMPFASTDDRLAHLCLSRNRLSCAYPRLSPFAYPPFAYPLSSILLQ
ncbi:MAG: hypothetical protein OXU76_01280 [Alphaproteobacteria bacterium]|nr:hypothetical protein [Alphaproteobacteria bacterium]